MPHYDVVYADRGTALVLKADLERGWRELQKTYGFFAQRKIFYKRDWSIRAQLSLIARPATFDDRAASFPNVSAGKCVLCIPDAGPRAQEFGPSSAQENAWQKGKCTSSTQPFEVKVKRCGEEGVPSKCRYAEFSTRAKLGRNLENLAKLETVDEIAQVWACDHRLRFT